jgi:hypothetical protein
MAHHVSLWLYGRRSRAWHSYTMKSWRRFTSRPKRVGCRDKNKKRGRRSGLRNVIDIPSLGASLHTRPTDHTDRAYRRRLELSNPDGRAIHLRRSVHLRRSSCNSGDGGRTNQRMPELCH